MQNTCGMTDVTKQRYIYRQRARERGAGRPHLGLSRRTERIERRSSTRRCLRHWETGFSPCVLMFPRARLSLYILQPTSGHATSAESAEKAEPFVRKRNFTDLSGHKVGQLFFGHLSSLKKKSCIHCFHSQPLNTVSTDTILLLITMWQMWRVCQLHHKNVTFRYIVISSNMVGLKQCSEVEVDGGPIWPNVNITFSLSKITSKVSVISG